MDWLEKMIKARQAITDKHGVERPKHTISDEMDCPICKDGTLYYSFSSYNGHISGQCETPNCVCWRE